jgi:hypothetical protein
MSSPRTRIFGLITIATILYWLAVIVAMHFLEPQFSPMKVPMSAYVSGDYGGWMTSSFFALATALLVAAFGVLATLPPNILARIGCLFFFVAALGVVLGGLFPGIIRGPMSVHWHAIGSVLAFPSMTLGAFLFSLSFCYASPWRRIAAVSVLLATGMLAIHLLRFFRAVPEVAGLMQRLFFLLFVPWLLLVGLRLIRLNREAASQSASQAN